MKNSEDTTATISAVDHRSTLRGELDAGILSRSRRRAQVEAAVEGLRKELEALDDADEVAYAAMSALEERIAGVRPAPKPEA